MAETRGVEHAKELFDILKVKYKKIRAWGVGAALGLKDDEEFVDLEDDEDDDDSGRASTEEANTGTKLMIPVVSGRRKSVQYSMAEMELFAK
jgi:hypothetical protein